MNLNDLYEMRDPRDAYQRDVDNSTSGFGKDSYAYRMDGGANDENHALDQQPTWYIRLNGKLIRDKAGNPYSFRSKAAANKAALTMQAKLFNKDKEFMLTTNPNDKPQGMAEGEQQMSRAAKGNEKYGKDGMKALAQAGRDGASDEKLDKIRDKYNKYDESVEQDVAEGYYDLPNQDDFPGMTPIDLSAKPSFKQIVDRYTQLVYQGHTSETTPEEDQEHDAIEQYVAQRFGEKGSAHLQKAAEVSYWGRDDKPYGRDSRSSNLGWPSMPGGNFRTTKAGKMHKQDVGSKKEIIGNRLGRHPEPALPEGEKVGNMDADRFDDAISRLKKLAGAGPMKTVWDPEKRVYKNIPTAVQPKK